MNTQFIIDGIGNSMKHWANYIHDVKRGKIINESAIKFGISEYLVASENLSNEPLRNKNTGVPQIQEIEFEKRHDVFKNRRIDLYFVITDGNENDKTEIFFEFKFLKKLPLPESESNRYINDLLRLASLAKHNKSKQTVCYFMLVGNPKQVVQLINGTIDEVGKRDHRIIPEQKPTNIGYCFSLQYDLPNIVVLGDFISLEGISHLNRFEEDYKYRDGIEESNKLENSDSMKISLKYKTSSLKEKVGVYIWQVEI